MDPEALLARHGRALARRRAWENTWKECYDLALPGRATDATPTLYDGTAADAAEQLAASLLAELTPPWTRWFGFTPGRGAAAATAGGLDADALAVLLEDAAEALHGEFSRSNFAVEIHQCFLDLVVAGTACIAVEEAAPGEPSALRFSAVPLADVVLEEGPEHRLDTVFRTSHLTLGEIVGRFGGVALPRSLADDPDGEPRRHRVLEAVIPCIRGYDYAAVLAADGEAPLMRAEGNFAASPFIAFRWMKAPGETYGRSPVMKSLPDIRTANKVVELVLKNASIAVTGIWQADDDGVLNPANIRLVPGAIIPKAVGSSGLTPLAAPGRFDVSQLVLDDLRARIRHALLADRLDPVQGARMTATEVLERSAEMARVLGATFGRLTSELINPLLARCLSVLRRRGMVPPFALDGDIASLQIRSPLAQVQARADAQGVLMWLEVVRSLGPGAAATADPAAASRWLARLLGVPPDLVISAAEEAAVMPGTTDETTHDTNPTL
ncbi:portal protein [Elioraea sp.]|uniref:portal protein n=1 Tax=Elioraea sp. TaxID=2185103 RepID=UPI0025C66437|nr:portal protein [Elioraea sp.]